MNDTPNFTQFIEDIEKDLLSEIITNLKRNKLEPARAQQVAKEFMSHLPPKDHQDLLNVLKNMSSTYPEASDIYVKYQASYDDSQKANLLAQHIAQGQIEKAIEVVKGNNNG